MDVRRRGPHWYAELGSIQNCIFANSVEHRGLGGATLLEESGSPIKLRSLRCHASQMDQPKQQLVF
jgi:hypothetical protein